VTNHMQMIEKQAKLLEARGGIEPPDKGFAVLCLTKQDTYQYTTKSVRFRFHFPQSVFTSFLSAVRFRSGAHAWMGAL
jgi:hypothetical protein